MAVDSSRKLRVDAQDNRDRILAAARGLFAERGLDVGMREVARRAAVGPATLYRRFPTKRALADEAFAAEVQSCRQIIQQGCADPDPWHGLTTIVDQLTVLNVGNRGFVEAYVAAGHAGHGVSAHRGELLTLLAGLVARARAARVVRDDLVVDDLLLVLLVGQGLAVITAPRRDAAVRRFTTLAMDALRR